MTARPRGTDSARVVRLIETKSLRGAGTEADMCRYVFQYWDFDGKKVAERECCAEEDEQATIKSSD